VVGWVKPTDPSTVACDGLHPPFDDSNDWRGYGGQSAEIAPTR
jgi:hypothetical protein